MGTLKFGAIPAAEASALEALFLGAGGLKLDVRGVGSEKVGG